MLDAPSDAPNADIEKYRDDIGDRWVSDVIRGQQSFCYLSTTARMRGRPAHDALDWTGD